jgi:hypothetical protein
MRKCLTGFDDETSKGSLCSALEAHYAMPTVTLDDEMVDEIVRSIRLTVVYIKVRFVEMM